MLRDDLHCRFNRVVSPILKEVLNVFVSEFIVMVALAAMRRLFVM